MIILIAESKTMRMPRQESLAPSYSSSGVAPLLDCHATAVMNSIAASEPDQLSSILKMTPATARSAWKLARDFSTGSRLQYALDAYTGVVFRKLDSASLSDSAREYLQQHLLIVSSLYGLLFPLDLIRPYRLEFSSRPDNSGKMMTELLRRQCTDILLEILEHSEEKEVLDLLPADASRCIDWKQIAMKARVCKADIKQSVGGDLKTPHSNRLKELRGELLRAIAETDTADLASLACLETASLMPAECNSKTEGVITFITR